MLFRSLGFLVFSGFLFYNSVYVWPKALAAAFMLFVLAVLLNARINNRALTGFEILLAAASFSLAIMAHPGSIFSLPALFLLLLRPMKGLRPSYYASAALIILLFAVPWMAYQKFYDPPGNHLLKTHLAGVIPVDSRSTWKAIKDSYGSLSLGAIFRNKWGNITCMFRPQIFGSFGLSTASRIAQRDYLFNAPGATGVAWLLLPFLLLRRNPLRGVSQAGLLIAVALVNISIWTLIMFGPGQTFTAESSYADILVMCIGLLGFLLLLNRWVVATFFALEVLNVFAWVLFKPLALPLPDNVRVAPTLHWPLLVTGSVCAGALVWHFGRSYFQPVCHTRA